MTKKIIERTLEISLTKENFRVLDEKERVIELAFASEYPVERWDGIEILECTTNAADLARLNSGGACLMNHDRYDQVGVVLEARVDDDKKIRAKVKLSRSARGLEVFNDVADGILRHVSFGYAVHEETRTKGTNGQPDTYRVTKFTPFEISIVSIPADPTVGIGRSLPTPNEGKKMADENENKTPEKAPTTPVQSIDYNAERAKARQEEVARINEIRAVSRQFLTGKEADTFIDEHAEKGTSVENVRKLMLEKLATRAEKPHQQSEGVPAVTLGLTAKEKRNYSFLRLVEALADKNPNKAGFELECSREIEKLSGKPAQGAYIPEDIFNATFGERGMSKRSLDILSQSAGGALVQTSLLSSDFIGMLRASSVTANMGARYLQGLRDKISIPRQTSLAAVSWISDTGSSAATAVTFDQLPLDRKTLGAHTVISRGLRNQASLDIEAFVMQELMSAMALGLDNAALNGDGTNNAPLGIMHNPLIIPKTYTTNPNFKNIVEMEAELVEKNAYTGNLSYATTPAIMAALKTTQKGTSLGFIWETGAGAEGSTPYYGTMNGHRTVASTQIPTATLIFANWTELLFGFWSGMDVIVNPYANDDSGGLKISVLQDVGLVVRRPESFSILQAA